MQPGKPPAQGQRALVPTEDGKAVVAHRLDHRVVGRLAFRRRQLPLGKPDRA
jgi:hypothetical protein